MNQWRNEWDAMTWNDMTWNVKMNEWVHASMSQCMKEWHESINQLVWESANEWMNEWLTDWLADWLSGLVSERRWMHKSLNECMYEKMT